MSTYAVFGMARHRAVEIARRRIKTFVVSGPTRVELSASEWEVLVQAEADKIMESDEVVQLSQMLDAPKFAEEFYDIAKRDGARRLHIKSHGKTGEYNTKNGRAILEWKEIQR